MKSVKRGEKLIILLLILFFVGMAILVAKVAKESTFYMSHSNDVTLGYVYDANGEVLFDPKASDANYAHDYFLDVGNLIGDDSGQMTNTLVSENLNYLQNYNLIFGAVETGKSAIYSTLNHQANRTVYDAFGDKNGTAIAYNYKTGEILVCVSNPNVNILDGYTNLDTLENGSLICKAFYSTAPGSTQKVATTIAAIETIGYDALTQKTYNCSGSYVTKYDQVIQCHNHSGHGTQNITQAFANSCNPFFAQLVQDLPLDGLINAYRKLGIAVNEDTEKPIDINGISSFSASTQLTDPYDFNTMWSCMGQSEAQASPCQLMLWQSAIANETGCVTMPYLIDHVTNVMGTTTVQAETKYSDPEFAAATASEVKQIMVENGQNNYQSIGYPVGVKSGTAQVENGDSENSLLSGFCTDPNLPIAFCVVIENNANAGYRTSDLVGIMLRSLDGTIQ